MRCVWNKRVLSRSVSIWESSPYCCHEEETSRNSQVLLDSRKAEALTTINPDNIPDTIDLFYFLFTTLVLSQPTSLITETEPTHTHTHTHTH